MRAEKIREHAVKLSQANEVLKRSLNGLARDKNLHSFVDQVLVVLTEQLGGHSSTLWLIDSRTAQRVFASGLPGWSCGCRQAF